MRSRGDVMKLAVSATMLAPVLDVALSAQGAPQKAVVGSPTLKADQTMPRDHTPDGRNVSPSLTWSNVPAGAKEFAVICEDPDAGNPPPFVHWVIYRIPATAKGVQEAIPIDPAAAMPAEIAGAIQASRASGVRSIAGRRRRPASRITITSSCTHSTRISI